MRPRKKPARKGATIRSLPQELIILITEYVNMDKPAAVPTVGSVMNNMLAAMGLAVPGAANGAAPAAPAAAPAANNQAQPAAAAPAPAPAAATARNHVGAVGLGPPPPVTAASIRFNFTPPPNAPRVPGAGDTTPADPDLANLTPAQVFGLAPRTDATATAAAVTSSPATGGDDSDGWDTESDESAEMDDGEAESEDDDEEEEDDSDDYETESSGSGDSLDEDGDFTEFVQDQTRYIKNLEKTYTEGVPLKSAVPLMLISRPFLHAGRQQLYKNVSLIDIFQASLLARSLTAEKHAAWQEGEEEANSLGAIVKIANFKMGTSMSMGRGGASFIIDILKCTNLEVLYLKPDFYGSVEEPLLEALRHHSNLKTIDFAGGEDPTYGLTLTTPRVIELMANCWPRLESLSIHKLKGSTAGTSQEEDGMWDRVAKAAGGKGRGAFPSLKVLSLSSPSCPLEELEEVLHASKNTLTDLVLRGPTVSWTPAELVRLILVYGVNLEYLELDINSEWFTPGGPEPANAPEVVVHSIPKGYTHGSPTYSVISKIAKKKSFLDPLVPFLKKLIFCYWTGPLATNDVFANFPPSVRTVRWGFCSSISPTGLTKLLGKRTTVTRRIKQPDGSFVEKQVSTMPSKGLHCVTVEHDDLHWEESEIDALEDVLKTRGACLHVSGPPNMPMNFGGGLGGLGGLGALGGALGGIPLVPLTFTIPLAPAAAPAAAPAPAPAARR